MQSLENRVAKLEAELLNVRYDNLSDDELRAYAYAQPFKSSRQYEALIALINRRGSAFPIVSDEDARAVLEDEAAEMRSQKNATAAT